MLDSYLFVIGADHGADDGFEEAALVRRQDCGKARGRLHVLLGAAQCPNERWRVLKASTCVNECDAELVEQAQVLCEEHAAQRGADNHHVRWPLLTRRALRSPTSVKQETS